MAKSIQVRDEVYQALAALKDDGKSFSDIIWELLTADKDQDALLELSPPLPGYDYDEVDRRMKEADEERWRELMVADRPKSRRGRSRR